MMLRSHGIPRSRRILQAIPSRQLSRAQRRPQMARYQRPRAPRQRRSRAISSSTLASTMTTSPTQPVSHVGSWVVEAMLRLEKLPSDLTASLAFRVCPAPMAQIHLSDPVENQFDPLRQVSWFHVLGYHASFSFFLLSPHPNVSPSHLSPSRLQHDGSSMRDALRSGPGYEAPEQTAAGTLGVAFGNAPRRQQLPSTVSKILFLACLSLASRCTTCLNVSIYSCREWRSRMRWSLRHWMGSLVVSARQRHSTTAISSNWCVARPLLLAFPSTRLR
jgi:hypothetical protein